MITDEIPQGTQLHLPRFAMGFMEDHAGLIMSDPNVAIVELVANSWDAGADRIEITCPETVTGLIEIQDNGTGMTRGEFIDRWLELNYSRLRSQGEDVLFPEGNKRSLRKAFGRNGKGRHSMFCFADTYQVETWRDGKANVFEITLGFGPTPFKLTEKGSYQKEGHGTRVLAEICKNHLPSA